MFGMKGKRTNSTHHQSDYEICNFQNFRFNTWEKSELKMSQKINRIYVMELKIYRE